MRVLGRSRRQLALVACVAVLASGCRDIVTLQLPAIDHLEVVTSLPVPSLVFDADGRQLAELGTEFREPITLGQLPAHVVDAVLTAEDRRFFDHDGVDPLAVSRAAVRNLLAGEVEQGGSTITQQLVKLRYLPDAPRTPEVKLQEALLARELESERTKASILEEYLNAIYLGDGAYGLGAAAWTYFRAEVDALTPAQAATLAAMIRAPEALNPTRAPDRLLPRRDDVLQRMHDDGFLSRDDLEVALATPLEAHGRPPAAETLEPHVVDLVVRTLLADPSFAATAEERAARLYGGGLRIHTTITAAAQEAARDALARALPDEGDPEAAIAAIDPRSGEVVALAGNRAYADLQFDLATQARRQPGSTFKGIVLAAAIADGWHPEDRLDGRQGTVVTDRGSWEVANYDRVSYPNVTLAGATRASVNTAYARLAVDVGIGRIAGLARSMGVRSPVPEDAQISIGGGSLGVTPLDMAAAYGTIGNLGTYQPTTVIRRIEDASGAIVWLPDTTGRPVLAPSAAFVATEVLRGVVEEGTGLAARVEGWEVAGKTGTTSDHSDAWFVGMTPTLATAVWIGRVEGRIPLRDVQGVAQLTGGSLPALIFADVTTALLAGQRPVPFVLPREHTRLVTLDPVTGLLAAAWCPGELERLPLVLVPTETCPEPPPPPPPPPRRPAPPPEAETAPQPETEPEPEPEPEPVEPDPVEEPEPPAPGSEDTGDAPPPPAPAPPRAPEGSPPGDEADDDPPADGGGTDDQ